MMPWTAAIKSNRKQTSAANAPFADLLAASQFSSGVAVRPGSSGPLHTMVNVLGRAWRWFERKRTQQLSNRRLRLTETISLGEKRSVSIVQVNDVQYLIGHCAGSVQLLARLDDQPVGDQYAAAQNSKAADERTS